jgi:predicted transcriptional regulator
MNAVTASQISKKIKSLPVNLLQEVDKFIDYLNYKSSHLDWSEQLSDEKMGLIEKGKKDIEDGKVLSHKEAKQRIAAYIKNKTI